MILGCETTLAQLPFRCYFR